MHWRVQQLSYEQQRYEQHALLQAIAVRTYGNLQVSVACMPKAYAVADAQPRNIQRQTGEQGCQKADGKARNS